MLVHKFVLHLDTYAELSETLNILVTLENQNICGVTKQADPSASNANFSSFACVFCLGLLLHGAHICHSFFLLYIMARNKQSSM